MRWHTRPVVLFGILYRPSFYFRRSGLTVPRRRRRAPDSDRSVGSAAIDSAEQSSDIAVVADSVPDMNTRAVHSFGFGSGIVRAAVHQPIAETSEQVLNKSEIFVKCWLCLVGLLSGMVGSRKWSVSDQSVV